MSDPERWAKNMKYWIRINGGDRGPYSAVEIAQTFGSSLPSNTLCAQVGENKWSTLKVLIPEFECAPPSEKNIRTDTPSPTADWFATAAAERIIAYCIWAVAGLLALPFFVIAEKTGREGYRVAFFIIISIGWITSLFLPKQILVISEQHPNLSTPKVVIALFHRYLLFAFLLPVIGPLVERLFHRSEKQNPFISDEKKD